MVDMYIFLAMAIEAIIFLRLGIYWGRSLERQSRIVKQRIHYKGYWLLLHYEKKGYRFSVRERNGKFVMLSPYYPYSCDGLIVASYAQQCENEGKKWIDHFVSIDSLSNEHLIG